MAVLKKVLTARISTCGGRLMYCSSRVPWDWDWDKRSPGSLVEPCNGKEDEVRYETDLANATPVATRNIVFIRHGQYNHGKTDAEKTLTDLGKEEADLTGKRMKELGVKYTHLIHSTMTRAKETAAIIKPHLPPEVIVSECSLLEEGAPPDPPDPPMRRPWEPYYLFEDGARIEAAFRKHIHRADVDQKEDSNEVIVFHANVIRYFLCRAMQFPGEAWLRISLRHASLSMITVLPNGKVVLQSINESGHLPPKYLTIE